MNMPGILQSFQLGQAGQGLQLTQRVQNLKNQLIGQQVGTDIPALAQVRARMQSFTGPMAASRPGVMARLNLGQREITVDVPTVLTAGTGNGGTTAPTPESTGLGVFEIVRA